MDHISYARGNLTHLYEEEMLKWFCDTFTVAAIGAVRYDFFVRKAFNLLVVSSR
jgi:hypothetical protein